MRFLSGAAALLVAANAFAGAETDALQRFVGTVNTLSATFQQVQKDENGAVRLDLLRAISSGVPNATISPPPSPASGPISTT